MEKPFRAQRWQIVAACLVCYDLMAVNAAYLAALWLRFDCRFTSIPEKYLEAWVGFAPLYSLFCMALFWLLRLYQSLWRFASSSELLRAFAAGAASSLFHAVGITLFFGRMPASYYVFGAVIQFLLVLAVRFAYRFVALERRTREKRRASVPISRVMLIGAGNAGQLILRDLQRAKEVCVDVRCIIDDDSNKWNRFICGVPIVGGRASIPENVKKYQIDKIFIAMPKCSQKDRRDILEICKETGCELKNLPGVYQFVTGEITVSKMRDVSAEDLLGREPVAVDMDEIFRFLKGKVILVTGGGGSIGSELCRQVAKHEPRQLVIFDVYENSAYEIEQELREAYPKLPLAVLIGSVRDSRKISQVFETYRPDVVYHAAAHKHVPLMEESPCEAIKNNTIGTYKTAYAAMASGCRKFVLISTDKAVNPTNMMGASKRLCEMVIQSFAQYIREGRERELPMLHAHADDEVGSMRSQTAIRRRGRTEFVAVRFGNVMGSNGSVIPKFKRQIENGGPVTVTHPDIVRYFMTIPEAVSLVLQAGCYAKGGEVFVLDMGEPVRIDALARDLIKLSGYKPDEDIRIEYTGLRPGEKLYEEKLMAEEGLKTTPNKLIHIGAPVPFDTDVFLKQMQKLMGVCYENSEEIWELVAEMVPTYQPSVSYKDHRGAV